MRLTMASSAILMMLFAGLQTGIAHAGPCEDHCQSTDRTCRANAPNRAARDTNLALFTPHADRLAMANRDCEAGYNRCMSRCQIRERFPEYRDRFPR
jgi:hypothetical protein